MVPANRKVPLSHDREQNPARTDDEVPSLHEDGGEQTALAAHVAHAFEDGRVVKQLAHAQWRRRVGVRLGKMHARNEQRGNQERKRIQDEDRISAKQRGHDSAQSRAQHEVQ